MTEVKKWFVRNWGWVLFVVFAAGGIAANGTYNTVTIQKLEEKDRMHDDRLLQQEKKEVEHQTDIEYIKEGIEEIKDYIKENN